MKEKRIGTYQIGTDRVDVHVAPIFGGNVYLNYKNGNHRIVVGMNELNWPLILSILLHESTELVCIVMGLRYSPSLDVARDNGAYYFAMHHTQFSEMSARTGEFLAECVPDLLNTYNKLSKKKK